MEQHHGTVNSIKKNRTIRKVSARNYIGSVYCLRISGYDSNTDCVAGQGSALKYLYEPTWVHCNILVH